MLRFGAIILALCAFVACVSSNDKAKTTYPEIDVAQLPDSALVVNFGNLNQGEVPFYEFLLCNSGDEPLVIVGFETECGCVIAEYPTKPIAAGDSALCRVEFHSAGQFGRRTYDVKFALSSKQEYKMLICAEIE